MGKLTSEQIEAIFGEKIDFHVYISEVLYYWNEDTNHMLVWKEFQETISVFSDKTEFICITRDQNVKNKKELCRLLNDINVIPDCICKLI